ncbi:hypothetical protein TNCV_4494361 [Trichonephila clavipes]|nr:hypothetical protein TNCV_4494361 [Trichonephila clavipes]
MGKYPSNCKSSREVGGRLLTTPGVFSLKIGVDMCEVSGLQTYSSLSKGVLERDTTKRILLKNFTCENMLTAHLEHQRRSYITFA